VIVDLWETAEHFQAMMDDPEFRKNVEASGWPSEPAVETYEVHAAIP
jgi:hypothetical protein